MRKMRFIIALFALLVGWGGRADAQQTDTLSVDSVLKQKLIKMAKEVVLKHGPGFYRDYKPPVVQKLRVTKDTRYLHWKKKAKNMGHVFYVVEYPYDKNIEAFYASYSAMVLFWEDLTIFDIYFGNDMGVLNYDKLSKSKKKNIVIPFRKRNPTKVVSDTIRDEEGNIIDIRVGLEID